MPDASLFDDICLLLNITLNELFAGERIASDDIPKKAEENLKSMALEYQKENKKLVKIGNDVFDWKLVHSLMRLTGNLIFFSSTNPKQIAVLYGDDCCAILCPVNAPAEGKPTIESLLEEDL